MLPRVDQGIRPAVAIEAPTAAGTVGDAKHEAMNRIAMIGIGKHVQAEIVSRLNDGTFFVKIAGATAHMTLPENVHVGDHLSLTLISLSPRPTFQLDNGQNKSTVTAHFVYTDGTGNGVDSVESHSVSKTQLQAEIASLQSFTSAEDSNIANSSAQTNLSNTGKLIDNILHNSQQSGLPTGLIGKAPIVSANTPNIAASQLTQQLQQTISQSGLFYESHVAEWAQGQLALSQLSQEPQFALTSSNAHATNDILEKDPTVAQMIQSQLDAQEQQKITWQGPFTDSIPLKWEITKDGKGNKASPSENADAWQSILKLDFPELGQVSITVNMYQGHVQLLMQTQSPETAPLLQSHAAELRRSLLLAGTAVDQMNIQHHG